MGQALPKAALRPFLGADTPMLAAIFVAAIEELAGEDYSEAQQQAWAVIYGKSFVEEKVEAPKRRKPAAPKAAPKEEADDAAA